MTRDELLDEYMHLRRQGCSRDTIARRLGITPAGLAKALSRAAADGDPRSDAKPRAANPVLPAELRQQAETWTDERCRALNNRRRGGVCDDETRAGSYEWERRQRTRKRGAA